MATYYVSSAGNNGNAGTIGSPWLTISYGVAQLFAGDTLYIRAGTYTGTANGIDSLAATVRGGTDFGAGVIWIGAYPSETVTIHVGVSGQWGVQLTSATQQYIIFDHLILDGTGQVNASESDYHGGFNTNPGAAHIRFQNGEIKNSPGQGVLIHGTDIQLLSNHIHHNGANTLQQTHNVYIATSGNLVQGNEIDHGSSCGVQVYDSGNHPANNIITKNTIHDNGVYGAVAEVFISYGADNLVSDNLIYHASNYVGIDVDFGSPYLNGTLVYNNTVLAGGIVIGSASSGAKVINNISRTYHNVGAGAITDGGSSTTLTTNLTTDPTFESNTSDYRLRQISAAVNAGTTLAAVPDDINGVTRPQGSAYCIGAYEFIVGAALIGATIYGPQNWVPGSFSKTSFLGTAYGGSDGAIAGYPEIAVVGEGHTVAGTGPSGEDVFDALDTAHYNNSGLMVLDVGSLGGQFDVRGPSAGSVFHAQIKVKLKASAFAESTWCVPLSLISGTNYGGILPDIASSQGAFLVVSMFQGGGQTGAQFTWSVSYLGPSGTGFTFNEIDGSADVADDRWVTLNVAVVPSTVSGVYATSGGQSVLNSAVVSSDGSFTLTIDGVTVVSGSGLQFVINENGRTSSDIYYGRGLGLGDGGSVGGDMAGPATGLYLYYSGNTYSAPPSAPPPIPRTVGGAGNGGVGGCLTTVLTTPSRTTGCNQGGTGWTPSYAPSSPSGTVPVGADPAAGETLTGKSGVHLWTEITNTIYPAGTSTETLRYALTDLDDATRKEGRLLSIGDVEYALSDGQGNLTAGTVDISISDVVGRPIGSRLIDSTKKYLARNEIAVFCLSDTGRRAAATPARIGRALLQDDKYETPVVATFSGTDPFFCDGGAFGPDKKFPSWTIPNYYINAPTDVYTKALPVIIGEVSDEGAIDPVTNLASSRGLCPLTFVGMDGLATGAGGAAEQWGRFNVCLFASYQIIALYGSNLGGGLYGRAGATSNSATPSVVTLAGSPDLSGVAVDGSVTIALYTAKGRQTSQITAVSGSTVTLNNTIAAGDATNVDWVIGEAQPTRVKLDLATRNGQDTMVFGHPNYVRATNYEDIMGSDGEAYRVTDIWVRGPLLQDHLAGIVTLSANVIGIEDIGDGSGEPITDYFVAYNWWLENCVIRNGKGGLYPAADGDLLSYADGTYLIKGSTFVTAQTYTTTAWNANGFKIGAYFGEAIPMRDAVQLWNDNGNCRLGINEHGQIFVWVLNRTADTTTWPRIEHSNRVFGPVSRTHPLTEIENVVQGTCDYDPDAQRYRNALTVFTSTSGILHNKTIRKYSKLIDGKLTRDPAQWNYVLQQRLAYGADGPIYVTLTGDIGLLDYPIGSGIQFTSPMGPGTTGYSDQPFVILEKRFQISSHLVTLKCLDVGSGSGMGLVPPVAQQFQLQNGTTYGQLSNSTAVAPVLV